MKLVLNKTNKSTERYTLINEPMGCSGEAKNSASHKYSIANGTDRGNGYQGYQSIKYFLDCDYTPIEAKIKVNEFLIKNNLIP